MKRGRKPQPETPETEQHIGHISVPIEDNDLQRVLTTLKHHGVDLRKIRTPDNWWLLLFPDGTVKTKKEMQGKVTISTIRLLDGFSLLYEEGIFNSDRNYEQAPKIFIEQELGNPQS